MDEITKLRLACDEVRASERLRKLMAIILTVGNQINTGGEGDSQAAGFSLDALLKLDEAKAFDKKTSVLFYLVKLIKENDEALLRFTEDITNVPEAQGLMIDSLFGDLKQMSSELEEIQKTADEEADRLKDENGKFINYSRKKSLAELQAQKTSVHNKDGVDHFNMMESEDEVSGKTFPYIPLYSLTLWRRYLYLTVRPRGCIVLFISPSSFDYTSIPTAHGHAVLRQEGKSNHGRELPNGRGDEI